MYDYTDILQKYRELCNIAHTACFIASHLGDAYERLKGILHEQAAMVMQVEERMETRGMVHCCCRPWMVIVQNPKMCRIQCMCLAEGPQEKAEVSFRFR
jgi:hypothetical protein